MSHRPDFRRVTVACAVGAALAACVQHPRIDASALQERGMIEVRVGEASAYSSANATRTTGENARKGAATGAAAGVEGLFSEVGLYAALLAPVTIVVMPVAGAGIGSAVGAASGSPHSRDEIDLAEARLERFAQALRPGPLIERTLADSLRAHPKLAGVPCIRASSSRDTCTGAAARTRLDLVNTIAIRPARSGAARGKVDFAIYTWLKTVPEGAVTPACIGWIYTRAAGSLFDLAASEAAFEARLRDAVRDYAAGFPAQLLASPGQPASSRPGRSLGPRPAPGRWERNAC